MSPLTGGPYGSPEEQGWTLRLSPTQLEYLRYLLRARQLAPDPAVDGEGNSTMTPAPVPEPARRRRRPEECISSPVNRKGGHARHDAYATKVTGSPSDYFVRTPVGLGINYDGLQLMTSNVWEVKVGFGWFFNAKSAGLTALTLARWDVQKNLGLIVAAACGYVHLWAHPDRYVAGLLLARWGGVPPVLNIPER
jgi:hypothetical protein